MSPEIDDDDFLYSREPVDIYSPLEERDVKKLFVWQHPVTQEANKYDTIVVDGFAFLHVSKYESDAVWPPPDRGKLQHIVNAIKEETAKTGMPIAHCILVEDRLQINAIADVRYEKIYNCLTIGTELINQESRDQLESCVLHELDHMLHKDEKVSKRVEAMLEPIRYMFDRYYDQDRLQQKLQELQKRPADLNNFYNSAFHALIISENLHEYLSKHPLFQQLTVESLVHDTETQGDSFRNHIMQYKIPGYTAIDLASLPPSEIAQRIETLNQWRNDVRPKELQMLQMQRIIKHAHEVRCNRAPIRAGKAPLIPTSAYADEAAEFTKDGRNHPSNKKRLEYDRDAAAGAAMDELLMTGALDVDAHAAVMSGDYQSSSQTKAAASLEILKDRGVPVAELRRPIPVRRPESQTGEREYALAVRAQRADKPRER